MMEENGKGIITPAETALARKCLEMAMADGASAARVSLNKSVSSGICLLDGKIDKVTYSADRSIFLQIFADGRYGTFSTNRLEDNELKDFVSSSAATVKLLSPDPCRSLPQRGRKAVGCTAGDELGLVDGGYMSIPQDRKKRLALDACAGRNCGGKGWKPESAEDEYSDSLYDNYVADTDGFEGRHTETSQAFCSEVTIKDDDGNRYSGYWWDSSPFAGKTDLRSVCGSALERAVSHIGPKPVKSGKYRVVVDRSCSSRLVGPLLNALDAQALQQNNSFLAGALGNRVFSPNLTLTDRARTPGCPGSRMFDSEGVATRDSEIIGGGTVRQYFVNTYMAGKTGMAPTVEGISRPCISPFICNCSKKEINLDDILHAVGDGIYIYGFNGGNCNPATGNFSFGVEGLIFRDGRTIHPVRGMLMTGDMLTLWNNLTAAGSDPRDCARWQIPTLAFDNVDINA